MTQEEMIKASSDPEFLKYLDQREKDVLESKNISGLYEVLDMLLILDLDVTRINKVYETILSVAFEQIEMILQKGTKLKLHNIDSEDRFYIRAFYEHSIEKWSNDDSKGAKELFYVLSQIIDDEKLFNAVTIKMLACHNNDDMEEFYENKIAHQDKVEEDTYAYFLVDFSFDVEEYLKENENTINEIHNELKSLLKV